VRIIKASQEWDLEQLIESKDSFAKYQEKSVNLAKNELKLVQKIDKPKVQLEKAIE
jgi:hypothetical protein